MSENNVKKRSLTDIIAETLTATIDDSLQLVDQLRFAAEVTLKVIRILQLIEKDVMLSELLEKTDDAAIERGLTEIPPHVQMEHAATEIVAIYRAA